MRARAWTHYLEQLERWGVPPWLRPLDCRTRNCILNALGPDQEAAPGRTDYSWITPERVREFGRARMAKEPNCGALTLERIGAAIGGWRREFAIDRVALLGPDHAGAVSLTAYSGDSVIASVLIGSGQATVEGFVSALRALADSLERRTKR